MNEKRNKTVFAASFRVFLERSLIMRYDEELNSLFDLAGKLFLIPTAPESVESFFLHNSGAVGKTISAYEERLGTTKASLGDLEDVEVDRSLMDSGCLPEIDILLNRAHEMSQQDLPSNSSASYLNKSPRIGSQSIIKNDGLRVSSQQNVTLKSKGSRIVSRLTDSEGLQGIRSGHDTKNQSIEDLIPMEGRGHAPSPGHLQAAIDNLRVISKGSKRFSSRINISNLGGDSNSNRNTHENLGARKIHSQVDQIHPSKTSPNKAEVIVLAVPGHSDSQMPSGGLSDSSGSSGAPKPPQDSAQNTSTQQIKSRPSKDGLMKMRSLGGVPELTAGMAYRQQSYQEILRGRKAPQGETNPEFLANLGIFDYKKKQKVASKTNLGVEKRSSLGQIAEDLKESKVGPGEDAPEPAEGEERVDGPDSDGLKKSRELLEERLERISLKDLKGGSQNSMGSNPRLSRAKDREAKLSSITGLPVTVQPEEEATINQENKTGEQTAPENGIPEEGIPEKAEPALEEPEQTSPTIVGDTEKPTDEVAPVENQLDRVRDAAEEGQQDGTGEGQHPVPISVDTPSEEPTLNLAFEEIGQSQTTSGKESESLSPEQATDSAAAEQPTADSEPHQKEPGTDPQEVEPQSPVEPEPQIQVQPQDQEANQIESGTATQPNQPTQSRPVTGTVTKQPVQPQIEVQKAMQSEDMETAQRTDTHVVQPALSAREGEIQKPEGKSEGLQQAQVRLDSAAKKKSAEQESEKNQDGIPTVHVQFEEPTADQLEQSRDGHQADPAQQEADEMVIVELDENGNPVIEDDRDEEAAVLAVEEADGQVPGQSSNRSRPKTGVNTQRSHQKDVEVIHAVAGGSKAAPSAQLSAKKSVSGFRDRESGRKNPEGHDRLSLGRSPHKVVRKSHRLYDRLDPVQGNREPTLAHLGESGSKNPHRNNSRMISNERSVPESIRNSAKKSMQVNQYPHKSPAVPQQTGSPRHFRIHSKVAFRDFLGAGPSHTAPQFPAMESGTLSHQVTATRNRLKPAGHMMRAKLEKSVAFKSKLAKNLADELESQGSQSIRKTQFATEEALKMVQLPRKKKENIFPGKYRLYKPLATNSGSAFLDFNYGLAKEEREGPQHGMFWRPESRSRSRGPSARGEAPGKSRPTSKTPAKEMNQSRNSSRSRNQQSRSASARKQLVMRITNNNFLRAKASKDKKKTGITHKLPKLKQIWLKENHVPVNYDRFWLKSPAKESGHPPTTIRESENRPLGKGELAPVGKSGAPVAQKGIGEFKPDDTRTSGFGANKTANSRTRTFKLVKKADKKPTKKSPSKVEREWQELNSHQIPGFISPYGLANSNNFLKRNFDIEIQLLKDQEPAAPGVSAYRYRLSRTKGTENKLV